MAKKVTVKNPRVPRTRNAETMTESAFWGMIRSNLRQSSRWWKPIAKCKMKARRPYKGIKKTQKWEFHCNICKQWFMDKEVQIDHIIDAGTLMKSSDLSGFVERLFCEEGGFQCVCKPCHQEKTNAERNRKKLLNKK